MFGCSVFVLHTNCFSDVTQTGICESVRKWSDEEPAGISDRPELREKRRQREITVAPILTLFVTLKITSFSIMSIYRKSVIKKLWKITGEHTANIKGLRGHESSLLEEGTEKEGHCWSTTYRNTGQLALHNIWDDESSPSYSNPKNKEML